jgi:hypothetical protein
MKQINRKFLPKTGIPRLFHQHHKISNPSEVEVDVCMYVFTGKPFFTIIKNIPKHFILEHKLY